MREKGVFSRRRMVEGGRLDREKIVPLHGWKEGRKESHNYKEN